MKQIIIRELTPPELAMKRALQGCQYLAQLRDGNGGGVGYYGVTAEDAEAKLRANVDCNGIVAQREVRFTDGTTAMLNADGLFEGAF